MRPVATGTSGSVSHSFVDVFRRRAQIPMPDQAFVLSNSIIDGNTIRVQWDIVNGYYMYRDKFKFTSDTPGITLGKPSFPPGKIKEDEFFGKVETYRKKVAVDIPITRSSRVCQLMRCLKSSIRHIRRIGNEIERKDHFSRWVKSCASANRPFSMM